jgi:hypothetical protein
VPPDVIGVVEELERAMKGIEGMKGMGARDSDHFLHSFHRRSRLVPASQPMPSATARRPRITPTMSDRQWIRTRAG